MRVMRLTSTVPFHALFFPAYLMSTGQKWTLLQSLSTTGASCV